jgi:hypothetical protein
MSGCGKSHFERNKKNKSPFKGILAVISPLPKLEDLSTVELYSSYLGKVSLTAKVIGENVILESIYLTIKKRNIYIKVLDLLENKLNENYLYAPQQLLYLQGVSINKTENLYNYVLTLYCYLMINKLEFNVENIEKYTELINSVITPELTNRITSEYPELLSERLTVPLSKIKGLLQKVTSYNSRVDILFTAIEYLEFISSITKGQVETINNQDILIFVSGVPNLDNAYWNGQYMVFGNGDSMFYPLTSIDVIGHELSHGFVQGVCDLEYKGHSGALNESFADIFGTMLEFYVHEKYGSRILGKSNWLIGEELTMSGSCLRNMEDPHACQQPKKMFDKYYVSPTSMIDYGGVHINSGIPNYCFYLTSQQLDKYDVLRLYIECLYKLYRKSDFYTLSNVLATTSNEVNDDDFTKIINSALLTVGLPSRSVYSPRTKQDPKYYYDTNQSDSFRNRYLVNEEFGSSDTDLDKLYRCPFLEPNSENM